MSRAADGLPALAAWHAGWAATVGLFTFGALWLAGLGGAAVFGAMAMVAPGLAGLGLLWRDGPGERALVLMVWTLAALAAAVLSGGMGGPLAGIAVMPFVAGLALGGPRHGARLAQAGAVGGALAAVAGQISALMIGFPEPEPVLATISILLAGAAATLAVRLSWRLRESRLTAAESGTHRIEALLAAQPGLTLVLEPSGRVLAAYGSPPPSLDVEALFEQGLIAAVHAPDRPPVLAALDHALAGREGQTMLAPRIALDRRVNLIVRSEE
ncbi:MAG: sensor histidine kinase, partial [Thermoleophilia bacterium]|nr:sensor histidine kinase [Thermoleophilia bacterium]